MIALTPVFRFGTLDLTTAPFAIPFGSDRGGPTGVVAKVQSALRDGSLSTVTGYENRTLTIPVLIEGANMKALADAEALLVQQAMKERNTFTFNPGDGTAADSVYWTFEADLRQQYDDEYERNGFRLYSLTFEADPWARSATMVTTPAVAAVAPTVLDSGSATTNWSAPAPVGATVSVVSGSVTNTYDPDIDVGTAQAASLRRTFPSAVNTSVSKFVAIDWKSSIPAVFALRVNGVFFADPPEVRREPGAAGYQRSWFKLSDTTTAMSSFDFGIVHPENSAVSATLSIDQVLLANELPAVGTTRQQTRTIFPGGNVTAEGTIILQHASEGLGSAVIFTHPVADGYSPPLRPWRLGGSAPVADSFAVSGFYSFLGTATTFFIPIGSVPTGDVHLWARVARNAVGTTTFTCTARSAFSGVYVGATQTSTTSVNFGAAFTYAMVPLARFTLPTSKVGLGGYVQIDIGGDAATYLDEGWLFAMDKGRLSVVECGTGTPAVGGTANQLLINAPTSSEPFGSIMLATRPDFADSWSPNIGTVLCDQNGHRFETGGSMIFTIASGPAVATAATVSLQHYPRWHTNAAT